METLAANHGSTFTSLVGLEKHTTYSMHFLNCEVTLGAPTPFKGYSEYKNSNILGGASVQMRLYTGLPVPDTAPLPLQ